MDLWIRSQDKMMLVKVNQLAMCKLCDSYDIMVTTDVHHQFICGTYSTKEKALKVLNEIQNLLIDQYIVDVDKDCYLGSDAFISSKDAEVKVLPKNCVVYRMPQDNDEQL